MIASRPCYNMQSLTSLLLLDVALRYGQFLRSSKYTRGGAPRNEGADPKKSVHSISACHRFINHGNSLCRLRSMRRKAAALTLERNNRSRRSSSTLPPIVTDDFGSTLEYLQKGLPERRKVSLSAMSRANEPEVEF